MKKCKHCRNLMVITDGEWVIDDVDGDSIEYVKKSFCKYLMEDYEVDEVTECNQYRNAMEEKP